MDKGTIDKCLDFAEGKKGRFTILMAKKPDFPETLIRGTEKQRMINSYAKQGFTTFEIAEMLGCTQPNIVEHMRQYKKSAAFYMEWCAFWYFSESVRQAKIADAFKEVLTQSEISCYESKQIITVGDFLQLAVTVRTGRFCDKLNGLDANKKGILFDQIRRMCYNIL